MLVDGRVDGRSDGDSVSASRLMGAVAPLVRASRVSRKATTARRPNFCHGAHSLRVEPADNHDSNAPVSSGRQAGRQAHDQATAGPKTHKRSAPHDVATVARFLPSLGTQRGGTLSPSHSLPLGRSGERAPFHRATDSMAASYRQRVLAGPMTWFGLGGISEAAYSEGPVTMGMP